MKQEELQEPLIATNDTVELARGNGYLQAISDVLDIIPEYRLDLRNQVLMLWKNQKEKI